MNIKKITALPLGFLAGIALLTLAFVLVQPQSAFAAGSNKNNTKTKQSQSTTAKPAPAKSKTKAKTYAYTAQPGDSYTKMARKATQTYGIVHKVKLSGAQIIYTETNLTQAAGSPVLEIGQKVTINQTDVASWIEKARQLDASTLAAWSYYVPFVNFNTSAVGESH